MVDAPTFEIVLLVSLGSAGRACGSNDSVDTSRVSLGFLFLFSKKKMKTSTLGFVDVEGLI